MELEQKISESSKPEFLLELEKQRKTRAERKNNPQEVKRTL
jgi:hypothetical protein